MTTYLLTIYQPDGPTPEQAQLDAIGRELQRVNEDIRAAGSWVFAGGLHPPESATVVRAGADDALITDGPYLEGKEHIGGLWIVEAPDLDVVLGWAERAGAATGLPIEVRPFQAAPGR